MDLNPVHDGVLVDIQDRVFSGGIEQNPAPGRGRLLLQRGLRVSGSHQRLARHLARRWNFTSSLPAGDAGRIGKGAEGSGRRERSLLRRTIGGGGQCGGGGTAVPLLIS